MAAPREQNSSGRIFRRYRFFFYFCFVILCIQLFLGYSFYSMNQQELIKLSRWKHDIDQKVKYLQNASHQSPSFIDNSTNRLPKNTTSKPKHFTKQHWNKTDWRNHRTDHCKVSSPAAISALSRAKTDACKTELRDITCLSQENNLYPSSLPRYCHVQAPHPKGEHLGCYQDKAADRDLANFNTVFVDDNSPQKCLDFCLSGGYQYAGVQFKEECLCGHSYGKHGKLPATSCASVCPGNNSQTCGGFNAQHIFSTGLPDKKPIPVQLVNDAVVGARPVRIVFALTVNGRAVRQVRRLVRTLYDPQHYFYIHVDSRNDYMYRELLPLEAVLGNVRLARTRFASIWGGASLLTTHLAMMRDLLDMADWAWDFYMNLSESDYPLKDVHSLTRFLSTYNGYNFLKSHGRETPTFIKKNGIDQLFYECEAHLWRLGKRALPTGILFDGGSDWLALHRDFCDYAVTSTDPLITGLGELYKYTLLPVESYFHTLLHNSKFCSTWVDNNLHLANWRRKQGCKCQHKAVVDWCGCSPNVLKSHDLDRLLAFKHKVTFFARKFEPIISQEIVNSVDASLGISHPEWPGVSHYWQSDFHSEDTADRRTDLMLTFSHALVRQVAQQLVSARAACSLTDTRVIENHLLYVSDTFHRYLVRYNGTLLGRPVTLQSQYSRKTFYRIIAPEGPIGRLQSLQVGTDFDLKELIFRNYAGVMGPGSELRLRHVWGQGPATSVTVAFIDPAGVVASVDDITIGKDSIIDMYKPELRSPLRPGVWTVQLLYGQRPAAEVRFLVIPLSVRDGRAITAPEVLHVHNGPAGTYSSMGNNSSKVKVSNAAELMAVAVTNGRKTGEELAAWVDGLMADFWLPQDSCTDRELGPACPYLSPCHDTSWSSLSPDPKSAIAGL